MWTSSRAPRSQSGACQVDDVQVGQLHADLHVFHAAHLGVRAAAQARHVLLLDHVFLVFEREFEHVADFGQGGVAAPGAGIHLPHRHAGAVGFAYQFGGGHERGSFQVL